MNLRSASGRRVAIENSHVKLTPNSHQELTPLRQESGTRPAELVSRTSKRSTPQNSHTSLDVRNL